MLSEIDNLIFRVNGLIDRFKEIRSDNINLLEQLNRCHAEISNMEEVNGKKELDVIYWKDKFVDLEKSTIERDKRYDSEISILKEECEKQNLEVIYWKNKSIDFENRAISLISEKDAIENILNNKLQAQEKDYKEKEELMRHDEHKLRDMLLSQESKISSMRNSVQSAINRLGELANKLPGVFSVEDDINGAS
ncbi:hypothetical protein [Candidatus Kinetoplastidibacterium galati]|uniref:Uncharacterized protein n=1 Tax=Candidatus Kinetoplastidibacterium galati TCC219 TaxID=1208921 RepID=M1L9T2_9PROT|nr:hypothetical protein [Candidatus Kinetoplastibacterium galatii]AGF49283.1 hypothetical protein ST1E_0003 [Candidatus Kinetoplastibacterium galatii TCC219]